MKRTLSVLLPLILSSTPFAATPIDGTYAGVLGGYSYIPNNIFVSSNGMRWTDASYNKGYHAGLNLGYKSNPMRYELELTYLEAQAKNFRINGIQQNRVSGDVNAVLTMGNVYYDLPETVININPYVGLGIGYAWTELSLKSLSAQYPAFKHHDTSFAYQGMLGLAFNYSENFTLSLGYRYVATPTIDNYGKSFQAHLASLIAVYRFDKNQYI